MCERRILGSHPSAWSDSSWRYFRSYMEQSAKLPNATRLSATVLADKLKVKKPILKRNPRRIVEADSCAVLNQVNPLDYSGEELWKLAFYGSIEPQLPMSPSSTACSSSECSSIGNGPENESSALDEFALLPKAKGVWLSENEFRKCMRSGMPVCMWKRG